MKGTGGVTIFNLYCKTCCRRFAINVLTMKIGWSIEHEYVNSCTKFGINQIKTEGSTGDQSEGDINPSNIFLSLRVISVGRSKGQSMLYFP